MKDALKRAAQALGLASAPVEAENLNTTDATTAVETVATVLDGDTGETVEMVTHTFEAPADAASYHKVVDELARATHKLDEQATALATASDQLNATLETLANKEAELAIVAGELAELKAAKEKAEADALTAKLEARQAAVVAALGTERADAFMAATKDMPDAQFNTVMAAMTATTSAEAKSDLFVEKGVDAQADVEALQAEAASNGTMAILKAKYQQPAAK